MTPSDLYFLCCLLGFFTWMSAPLSELRTPKARTSAKRKQTKQVAARTKKPKTKRTKVKKQKRYKAPDWTTDDQIRYDMYLYKRNGIT